MNIETRTKILMEELKISQIELGERSGISQQVWSKAFNGRQRMNSSHIEFICKQFPEYTYWLMTGDDNNGSTPSNAKAFAYYSKAAENFAEAKAEYEYAILIFEYLSINDPILDTKEGVFIQSPLPSMKESIKQQYIKDMFYADFNTLQEKLVENEIDGVSKKIDEYFFWKSRNEVERLTEEYGENHRLKLMLSRILNEFKLLPS